MNPDSIHVLQSAIKSGNDQRNISHSIHPRLLIKKMLPTVDNKKIEDRIGVDMGSFIQSTRPSTTLAGDSKYVCINWLWNH